MSQQLLRTDVLGSATEPVADNCILKQLGHNSVPYVLLHAFFVP